MPAFVLLPPTSLAAEHPEMVASLLANADHLTSHLDLYVTLREVLAMGSKEPLVEPTRGSISSYHLIILSPHHLITSSPYHLIILTILRFARKISAPPC